MQLNTTTNLLKLTTTEKKHLARAAVVIRLLVRYGVDVPAELTDELDAMIALAEAGPLSIAPIKSRKEKDAT